MLENPEAYIDGGAVEEIEEGRRIGGVHYFQHFGYGLSVRAYACLG